MRWVLRSRHCLAKSLRLWLESDGEVLWWRAEDGNRIYIPTNSATARPHFAACDMPETWFYPSRGIWVVRAVYTFQLTISDLLLDC